jgi:hypothetical protein
MLWNTGPHRDNPTIHGQLPAGLVWLYAFDYQLLSGSILAGCQTVNEWIALSPSRR